MVNQIVINECRNKKVLHLGALGDYRRYIDDHIMEWDFYVLTKRCRKIVGIDICEKRVKVMKKMGYNILYGNAENFDLKEKFDIIYAGDLIEHLNNVGLFLTSVKKHMNKNSKLIITIPNPYSINMILRAIFGKTGKGIYDEHSLLLEEKTLR